MLTLGRKRSWVWSHAKLVNRADRQWAVCSLCETSLSYCGSPSAIANHLQAVHKLSKNHPASEGGIADENVDDPSLPGPSNASVNARKRKRTSTGEDVCSRDRQETITMATAELIATNLLPLSLVASDGFRNFMNVLEPGYQVPCEQTIRSRVQVLYNTVRDKVQRELDNAQSVALTIDEWSSRAQDGYLSVEAQFITDDGTLLHYTICNREFAERPTSNNIVEAVHGVMKQWKISNKVQAVVHDSASAMVLAGKNMDIPDSVKCTAHLLQLTVKDALSSVPTYEEILKHGSSVVGHFRHSNLASTALSKRQLQLGLKEERLAQNCPTRWDSSFRMVECLLRNRNAIELVLSDREVTKAATAKKLEISETDWNAMENIVKILKPFQVATTVLCSESAVTLSQVHPIVNGLYSKHMKEGMDDDADVDVDTFKTAAKVSLEKRFCLNSDNVTAARIASFLDPRFKNLSHESEKTVSGIKKFMEGALESSHHAGQEENKVSTATALDFLFQAQVVDRKDAQGQLISYINMPQLDYNMDPLQWWKDHKDKYPELFTMSKKYLGIPATSALSERTFSSSGNIVKPQRSCLNPENVDMLTFLYRNRCLF